MNLELLALVGICLLPAIGILAARRLSRSGPLSLLGLFVGITLFVAGGVDESPLTILSGLGLVAVSALACLGALARSVGAAVAKATGSKTLGYLAARGMALIVGAGVADGLDLGCDLFDEGLDVEGSSVDPGMQPIAEQQGCSFGSLPGPEGYGAPSLHDGDPRVLPVRGYERVRSDGSIDQVDGYWRGQPDNRS